MPYTPAGPCSVQGCPARAVRRGRCEQHAREAAARYRAAHPDQRPSASDRGYGADWREIRKTHLAHQPYCVLCARRGVEKLGSHVDHIVPRAQGGGDGASNLQTLCHSCHSRKTAMVDGGYGNRRGPEGRVKSL